MRVVVFSAIACALAGAAAAQDNDQVQLDDTFALLRLRVDEAREAGGSAIASGNLVTATGDDVSGSSAQDLRGDVTARSDATVWTADGAVVTGAWATGNGGTAASSGGDLTIDAEQNTHRGADISAHASSTTGNTYAVAASATASANSGALSASHGDLTARVRQTSASSVHAFVEADACCVSSAAVADAMANANSLAASGSTTTMLVAADQVSSGAEISARSDLYVGYAGDAVGGATAAANSVTADNAWGYLKADVEQSNASDVTAESYVTLGGDWTGAASATSYGVGNTAAVSNVGSDTAAAFHQFNAGDVSAFAALAGEGGAYGIVSATAIGNNASASLCWQCENGSLSIDNRQVNTGAVTADATIITPRAGGVYGTATAIGNGATFVSRQNGN